MRKTIFVCLVSCFLWNSSPCMAGDDASGPVSYSVDFSEPFTTYKLSPKDRNWGQTLADRLHYTGKIVYFVRTSLPLSKEDKTLQGSVYQSSEEADLFYIPESDAMFKFGLKWPFTPGVSGSSLYAPKSRNYVVCIYCEQGGGVPFLRSTPVIKGKVEWKGRDDRNKLDGR